MEKKNPLQEPIKLKKKGGKTQSCGYIKVGPSLKMQ